MAVTKAFGVTLQVGGTSGTTLGSIVDLPFPSVTSEDIDTTSHDSVWKTKEGGTRSVEDMTVRLKFVKSNYSALVALMTSSNNTITIAFPTPVGTTTTQNWKCEGRIKGLSGQPMGVDDDIEHDVVLAFSGAPTQA